MDLLIPSTAAAVRRLHDTNRSRLWLLMIYIPEVFMLFFSTMIPLVAKSLMAEESNLYVTLISIIEMTAVLSIPVAVIQLVGIIWLLVLFMLKGTVGENRFGSDPLVPESDEKSNVS
ncbi:MAG: DUF805 domain-containing protein [Rhodospirillaceae bacterium]|nr:DUF805 domain-containing protein [Rhodospirillaceae bacterium]